VVSFTRRTVHQVFAVKYFQIHITCFVYAVKAVFAMANRRPDQYPLRMSFDDSDSQVVIAQALKKWTWWLHVRDELKLEEENDLKESQEDDANTELRVEEKKARRVRRIEREKARAETLCLAEIEEDKFENEVDKSSMFYVRRKVFPWLWKWIERLHGTHQKAYAWRLSHPQSDISGQVRSKNSIVFIKVRYEGIQIFSSQEYYMFPLACYTHYLARLYIPGSL